MRSFTKVSSLIVITLSTLSLNEANAFCAKCAKIEQERAEEQAKAGPQPVRYYDEEFKNQITPVNNTSTSPETTNSSVNTTHTNTKTTKTTTGSAALQR